MTVAAILLHSIFGCQLHHACASHCDQQQVSTVLPAQQTNDCHQHEHVGACSHTPAEADLAKSCCASIPCDQGGTPCCSEIQCSFILSNGVVFYVNVSLIHVLPLDIDAALASSEYAKFSNAGPVGGALDSGYRCALHSSWQI
jgi:hypothetical protein